MHGDIVGTMCLPAYGGHILPTDKYGKTKQTHNYHRNKMSGNKFQGKYRIPSARHPWHGYNSGLYFITICTRGMEHYFGEIITTGGARRDDAHIVPTQETNEPIMHFTEIGKYAVENLEQIKTHYPYCEIPVFVVMPNHIHAIVVIDDDCCRMDAARHVDTMCTSYLRITTQNQSRWKNAIVDEKMQSISHKRGQLSTVIGGFKRAVTRYANQNNIPFKWQERFHDRIIRGTDECNRIVDYIKNNPYNWKR